MPYHGYHTGIRRDETNKTIWRRSGDGTQVELDGWYPGQPDSRDGYDFLYWGIWNDPNKNTIFNERDASYYFICEY